VKSKVQSFLITLDRSDQSGAFSFLRKLAKSDFARKVIETLLTRVILIGIGFVTSIIVARILGPEGRGVYSVASTTGALVVQFGNIGLHASNSYYVAKNRELLLPLLSNTFFVSLGLGFGLAIIAQILFSIQPGLAPIQGPILILTLAWVPFGLLYLLLQNLLIGTQNIRAYNNIEVGNRVISVLVIAGLILANWVTVETVYVSGLVALMVCILWTFWQFKVSFLSLPFFSSRLFLDNIRYGIKAYLSAIFAFLILRSDMLMIQYILGPIQAGYYSVAVSLADMVYMIPAVVGTIIFPKLSTMDNDVEKWKYTKKVIFYLGIALSLTIILAIPLSKSIIQILYGKAFLPAVPAFVILGVAAVFYGINNLLSNCLAAMDFPWFIVNIYMVVAVVNIFVNLFMIKIFGIVGASLSSLICYFILMLSQYVYLKRRE
jgi:O-antigen/teichoic acid export membrane protein